MKNTCARADTPAHVPAVALQTVWDVDEDATYDVRKHPEPEDCLIAIRTLRGAGRVHLDRGDPQTLTPGTLFLIERNHIRRYHCDGPRWQFWWFEFTATGSLRLPLGTILTAPAHPADARDFRTLFTMLGRRRAAQRSVASAVFGVLLHRWAAHWDGAEFRTPHHAAIERVIDAMSARLESGYPVTDMATAAHMSVRAFRNAFHAGTGLSPKTFFDRLRLSMAEELLKLGIQNVSEVAYRLGYSSPFHFSKAFRKRFGKPPSALRP